MTTTNEEGFRNQIETGTRRFKVIDEEMRILESLGEELGFSVRVISDLPTRQDAAK